MKFSAIGAHLTSALQVSNRAITSKNTSPLLQGVYLECDDQSLKISGTDLDLHITCTIPVQVIEPGATVVQGKAFTDLVRRLPEGPVLFESTKNGELDSMHITYGEANSTMQGWNAGDYPDMPVITEEPAWTIPAASFKNIVRQTSFIVKADEIRAIFTGLLFEVRGHELTVVGTDSFRLTYMKGKINNIIGEDDDVIIPVRALNEVAKIAEDDSDIKVYFYQNKIIFDVENVRITALRIRGEFPAYSRVIPDSYNTFFKIKKKDLIASIERAMIFTQDRNGTPAIYFNIENDVLSIHTESEAGMVNEHLSIYQEGDAVEITFNSHFILDALKSITFEDLDITLSGTLGPCVMRPANDDQYLYLLLPLRR